MGEVNPHLAHRHRLQIVLPHTILIDRFQRRIRRRRKQRTIRQWKVENSLSRLRMTHDRTEQNLKIDANDGQHAQFLEQRPGRSRQGAAGGMKSRLVGSLRDLTHSRRPVPPPARRRNHRQPDRHAKENLRQTRMGHRNPRRQHVQHGQSAQKALNTDRDQRHRAEPLDPARQTGKPQPRAQHDRQKTYGGADEPMHMLIPNAADPFGRRKREHVLAVSRRPVRHRQARTRSGHHAAGQQQKKRTRRHDNGKPMKPHAGRGARLRRIQS